MRNFSYVCNYNFMKKLKIAILPTYAKYIGLLINIISLIIGINHLLSGTSIKVFFSVNAEIEIFAIYAMLILGSVLMVFSKEKVEDEFINYLRLRSFFLTVIVHALFFFVFSFTNLTLFLINFPAIILMDSVLLMYLIIFYTYKIKELKQQKND